jgi:serine phosphatase RsbU (regulator of sigma subunit)
LFDHRKSSETVVGHEVELPGALPLGIEGDVSYEVKEVCLELASRFTFYSDGVVEAQNKSAELLGFDRARELSSNPAAATAEAAKAFGQANDITVITVERIAVEETFKVVRRNLVSAPA